MNAENRTVLAWTAGIAATALLAVLAALVIGLFGPATGVGGNFCEAARDALIKQPANTWSNLGFIAAGLVAAAQLRGGRFAHRRNALTRGGPLPVLFCGLAVLLGPGSMAMHASETTIGGYFDMLSMYLIVALINSYAAGRLLRAPVWGTVGLFLLVLGVCHVFHFSDRTYPVVGFAGNFIFAVFVVLGAPLEVANKLVHRARIGIGWGVASLLTMAVALAIWTTGRDAHPWCRPHSLLQAHALWHLLNALAVYLLFRFYVSEDVAPKTSSTAERHASGASS